jgi:hypothetical protein
MQLDPQSAQTINQQLFQQYETHEAYLLLPKWEQTLFWNGESPNGNFLVCLPVSIWGSPYENSNPHMENIPFFLNPQMGTNSVLEWISD